MRDNKEPILAAIAAKSGLTPRVAMMGAVMDAAVTMATVPLP
jgi:hypothetical protein